MEFRRWEELPAFMQTSQVYPYYCALAAKRRTAVLEAMAGFCPFHHSFSRAFTDYGGHCPLD